MYKMYTAISDGFNYILVFGELKTTTECGVVRFEGRYNGGAENGGGGGAPFFFFCFYFCVLRGSNRLGLVFLVLYR